MPPKQVLKSQAIVSDFLKSETNDKDLLFFRKLDTFYRWQGGWYKSVGPDEMTLELYRFVWQRYTNDLNITMSYVRDLTEQLKVQIPQQIAELSKDYICFQDCLLDINTFTTLPHDRTKISVFYLPFKYTTVNDGSVPTENWQRFLSTSLVRKNIQDQFETDPELVTLCQEMMGDFLLPHLFSHTAYFLVGNGANGKSVLLDIISEIMGDEFISSLNIEALTTDKFTAPHLIGKRINISNEEESKFIKSDKFKAIVTGDKINAQRKFGSPFDFKPDVKFVFASNKIPTFSEINYGIIRRIKILPFLQRFNEDNPLTDPLIKKKLLGELPGIVNWALEGAKRLVAQGFKHSHSTQAKEALEEFEGDISSAVMFFRENYIVNSTEFTSNEALYADYRLWCDSVGRKPLSKSNFGRDLISIFVNLKNTTGRGEHGEVLHGKGARRRGEEDNEEAGVDIENIPGLFEEDNNNQNEQTANS